MLLVVLLGFSVVSATGAAAWAAPLSASQYLKLHPNLTLYLDRNPGVAQQVLTPSESADDLVSKLVQVVNGFGSGYLAKHPDLALYLAHNPEVARLVLDYQGQTGSGQGQSGSGAGQFTDVPSWAQQAVGAMSARGIINGMGNGIFGSSQTLTRAQFAALLVREFGLLSTSGSVYGTVTFADVPSTFRAYKYIEAAVPDMPTGLSTVKTFSIQPLRPTGKTAWWAWWKRPVWPTSR